MGCCMDREDGRASVFVVATSATTVGKSICCSRSSFSKSASCNVSTLSAASSLPMCTSGAADGVCAEGACKRRTVAGAAPIAAMVAVRQGAAQPALRCSIDCCILREAATCDPSLTAGTVEPAFADRGGTLLVQTGAAAFGAELTGIEASQKSPREHGSAPNNVGGPGAALQAALVASMALAAAAATKVFCLVGQKPTEPLSRRSHSRSARSVVSTPIAASSLSTVTLSSGAAAGGKLPRGPADSAPTCAPTRKP